MSTNNFYSKSGKYYALDDESSEQFEDGGGIEDLIDSLTAAGLITTTINESIGDRNYPGRELCAVTLKNYDNLLATCLITLRSGYYSGANLDYEIRVYDQTYTGEYIALEDLNIEDVQNAYDDMITPRQCQKILDDLMREVDTLEQKISDVLKEVTTPLEKVAQFSNGECIYKEVTR